MAFLKQIKLEIRNILKSRFLLIIGIIIVATGILLPVLNLWSQKRSPDTYEYRRVMDRGGSVAIGRWGMDYMVEDGREPIIIDGVTIEPNSPFYWNIEDLNHEREMIEMDKERFSDDDAFKLALASIDAIQSFYVQLAEYITEPGDYRVGLAWTGENDVYAKFIYEHSSDIPAEKMYELIGYRMPIEEEEFKKKYTDLSEEERKAEIDILEQKINTLFKVVKEDDFPQYIDLRIQQEKNSIEELKKHIETQEEIIIKNPSQEEHISRYIEDMKKEIELIETNNIPMLEYRLEKNIIPGTDAWQNVAMMEIEQNRQMLMYDTIMKEEEFNKDTYMVQEFKSYQRYVKAMQAKIDEYNNAILIAQRSLEADKPDMGYVYNGARKKTVDFLSYSIFVSMYAALIGGWIIASEFQQGTIRLLMIRPKTRTKILMAKFTGAFIITIGIYILGSLLNFVTNGICFGFSDYAYPNYTISGEISFFGYYMPKFLTCMIPIIFSYTIAFMFSVIIKNVAVAVIIPIAFFIGSTILMDFFAYSSKIASWIAYTPIPYMQMSSFFTQYSNITQAVRRGIPISLAFGIVLLLALSSMFIMISIFSFKNRDITN